MDVENRSSSGSGGGVMPKQQSDRDDDAFYKSKDWLDLRAKVIERLRTCGDPFGTHKKTRAIVAAVDVHHKKRRRDHPELELDEDNLIPVCKECHGKLTAQEKKDDQEK